MAIALQYSTDRGVTWNSLTYTHPTSAGVYHRKVPLGAVAGRANQIRFRLTGTDAANWGLLALILKMKPIDQEHPLP